MRRRLSEALFCLLLTFGAATSAHAQEAGKQESTESSDLGWKWANFAIFAAGMGYLIVKLAPSFFNARSADIQKAIKDATGLKMQADLRYNEADRKMAELSNEVARLRAENKIEMEREYARLEAQTRDEVENIQKSTAAEIEALAAQSARDLRAHATQQALAQAEKRLRDRFAQGDGKDLLNDFVNLVERGKN